MAYKNPFLSDEENERAGAIAREIYYECLYEGDLDGLQDYEQIAGLIEFYHEHYSKLPGGAVSDLVLSEVKCVFLDLITESDK